MDGGFKAKDGNIGRILFEYLRSKLKGIALFLSCMLVFFAVCLLYQLDNIPKLLYAFYLWAFIGFCHGAYDFTRYAKRYNSLRVAFTNIENMRDMLPLPEGAIERQYGRILDMLLDERRGLLTRVSFKDTDMTDYYTMWAHQIKVPIAAARLLLQNAEDLPNNRLLSEELFKIEQYVEMVLYYQRLDSINSDFLFKEYDLREIVNQAVKKHSMFFINNRLTLNLEDFSLPVVTDEKWLQFVIGQILFNSLKYTSRGGISIRLERNSEKAFLIIEDTGIGIRPEDLPRIFERGFTGYNGRLDKKSTGIGLYLSKKILEKLSHTIEVTSDARGTRAAIGFILTKM